MGWVAMFIGGLVLLDVFDNPPDNPPAVWWAQFAVGLGLVLVGLIVEAVVSRDD